MSSMVVVAVGLLVLVIVGTATGAHIPDNANYRIKTTMGEFTETFYVESYTKEDQGQCIFMAEHEVRFCGGYKIEKLNKDE